MNFDAKKLAKKIAKNEEAEEREVVKSTQGPRSRSAVVKPSDAVTAKVSKKLSEAPSSKAGDSNSSSISSHRYKTRLNKKSIASTNKSANSNAMFK